VDEFTAEAAFREEVRAWLAEHARPYRSRSGGSLVFADVGDTDHVVRGKAWQRELFDGGWAGLGWPVEHGGRALTVGERVIWAAEVAAAGLPPAINLVGEAMVGPTLMVHGTEEQRRRHLAPILAGDEIWCQLFSEPDAGTDLAAVTTTAAASADGDGWVVTGHKLWTSAAHYADWGVLLARSDWEAPKHRGCTYFLVDMRSPGVTVRPVRQMTGGTAFNEVLLDRVRVPDSCRVGDAGGGWAVAVTTLAAERLSLGLGATRVAGSVERLLAELRPRGVSGDPGVRQVAAQVWIDAKVLELLGERMAVAMAEDGSSGAEGAVARLASIRLSRRTDELLDAMRGAGAMLVDDWTLFQLWIPATRIGGGTEEILRSVVAERVLGLPKSPRQERTGDTFRPNRAVSVTGSPGEGEA
jgi:acyl-CoA dehydrogenase